MAFVANGQDEEEDKKGQGAVAPIGGGAVHLAPSAGVGTAGTPGSTGGTVPQGAGGQFATLDKYINANQGQAEPLTGKILGNIQNQYSTLDAGNQTTLGGISDQVKNAPGYTPGDADLLAKESANPVSFASDPNNVGAFQKQLNNSYSGPTSVENDGGFQKQQAAINSAISQGQAQTGSEAGRAQLLRGVERTPGTGVTALNSAILSQDPNALGSIENAYKPFSNLVSGLNSGATDINKTIAKQQTDAASSAAAANKAIEAQTSGLNSKVQDSLNTAQKQYEDYNNATSALGSQLQNGQLPVGYGVDPGLQKFVTNNVTPWATANGIPDNGGKFNFANAIPQQETFAPPSLQTAATPDDYKLFSALTALTNGATASPLQGLDATKAGTYKAPPAVSVDNKALAGDIYSGLTSGSTAKVSRPVYEQYLGLLAALKNYQGLPVTGDPFGSGWSGTTPTIE